jgi:hypothetical protein
MNTDEIREKLLNELSEALAEEGASETAFTQAENRRNQARTDRRRILGEILKHASVGRNIQERILFLRPDDQGRTRQLLLTYRDPGESSPTSRNRIRVQLCVNGDPKRELDHAT